MTEAVPAETDADGVRTLTFNRLGRRSGRSSDPKDAHNRTLTPAADSAVRAADRREGIASWPQKRPPRFPPLTREGI